MFLDDPKTRTAITKWAIGTVAACILIFLGVRYISVIAMAVDWLIGLIKPLLIGTMLALILNVPLDFIEKRLFRKKPSPGEDELSSQSPCPPAAADRTLPDRQYDPHAL